MDDSDASEKENEEQDNADTEKEKERHHPSELVCLLHSKTTSPPLPPPPPPPPPPPSILVTKSPGSDRNLGQLVDKLATNGHSENDTPWEPLESVGLTKLC